MPELPEVEIIKSGLEKKIIGSKIKKIEILNAKSFHGNPQIIIGGEVAGLWRRAKILGIEVGRKSGIVNRKGKTKNNKRPASPATRFAARRERGEQTINDKLTLLSHLKMSGQLILAQNSNVKNEDMLDRMPNKSTRVIFEFDDDSKLFFNDQRKFGWIKVFSGPRLTINDILNNLGPEPLEKTFTWQTLKRQLFKRKNQPVKITLLDQTLIAGIGNIYASESLLNAKIHPQKRVVELTDPEFKKLQKGIVKALQDGIKYGGSTRTHFVDSEGRKGYFLDYAKVYNRYNKPCKICNSLIVKITQAGRSTFYCPSCQK